MHAEGRDHLFSEATRHARLQKAAPHQWQPGTAGEEDIVRQREFQHRAMAVAFLRHHAQPQYTPSRRAKPASALAGDPDLVVTRRQPLAGERSHQLALAVVDQFLDQFLALQRFEVVVSHVLQE